MRLCRSFELLAVTISTWAPRAPRLTVVVEPVPSRLVMSATVSRRPSAWSIGSSLSRLYIRAAFRLGSTTRTLVGVSSSTWPRKLRPTCVFPTWALPMMVTRRAGLERVNFSIGSRR